MDGYLPISSQLRPIIQMTRGMRISLPSQTDAHAEEFFVIFFFLNLAPKCRRMLSTETLVRVNLAKFCHLNWQVPVNFLINSKFN